MTTYTVEARRSDDWWALSVPQLPGVHSQARSLAEAASMASEAIALFLDVPERSFGIEIEHHLSDRSRMALNSYRRATPLNQPTRMAATAVALLGEGIPVDDVAALLNVTKREVARIARIPQPRPDRSSTDRPIGT